MSTRQQLDQKADSFVTDEGHQWVFNAENKPTPGGGPQLTSK